jgi:endonuclease G, mitochondrial
MGNPAEETPLDGIAVEAEKQRREAEKRVAKRSDERGRKIDQIRTPGALSEADSPERVLSRIDRLSRYYPDVRPVSPAGVLAGRENALAAAGAILERVINTPDFVDVRYLEAGSRAARAIGRVDIRDGRGRLVGYGTGSLVSPRLLLTNHHVLPDAATAASSAVEFNYEDGVDGRPLLSVLFPLDPAGFFLADETLDFALVAVGSGERPLSDFGFNPLIPAEGKAIAGDFVSIVQHPRGEKKQVALRDNRIVDVLDNFLHYQADTEPGSSGSPVFNDQWEVVGLHHASVPAPEHTEFGGFVNEGIRVSRLLKFISGQQLPPAQKALVDQLPAPETVVIPGAVGSPVSVPAAGGTSVTVPVPLEVTVRLANGAGQAPPRVSEAIQIDPDYSDRPGYEPEFLGSGEQAVPLPTLAAELIPLAAINTLATAEPRYLLPYHHFTVAQNKERGLAFFTAVNIDGATSQRLKRERDRWAFDPRIPEDEQTGTKVYEGNDLDLGHLVRRLDPAWGDSKTVAKLANDDTFHLTNCTPQHKDFNRNKTSWAGLEDYVLEHADNLNFRVSVFTGPVLAPDDDEFNGVQLPRQFWKVVAMVKTDGDGGVLSATAYLLSQKELIEGLEVSPEAFSYAEYRTYQVPVRRVEDLTQLSFGSLANFDPLAQGEHEAAIAVANELEGVDDAVL